MEENKSLVLFRCEEFTTANWGYDHNGEPTSVSSYNYRVVFYEYDILKETSQGYWINGGYHKQSKSWVSKTSTKRFAYPTKKEAIESFIARKRKQARIYERRMHQANEYLKLAETMIKIDPADDSRVYFSSSRFRKLK